MIYWSVWAVRALATPRDRPIKLIFMYPLWFTSQRRGQSRLVPLGAARFPPQRSLNSAAGNRRPPLASSQGSSSQAL